MLDIIGILLRHKGYIILILDIGRIMFKHLMLEKIVRTLKLCNFNS